MHTTVDVSAFNEVLNEIMTDRAEEKNFRTEKKGIRVYE